MNSTIKNMALTVPFTIAMIGLASPASAFRAPDVSAYASEARTVQITESETPATATKRAPTKICLAMPALTGSRMASRKCKTKAEWEMLGYEFSEKK